MDDWSIKSARGKLRRAATLLDELGQLRDDYVDDFTANVQISERQVLAPDGEWTVRVAEDVPDLPDEIPNVAGDAMHNVRSALDHVACAYVVASGNPVTKQNAFPIREKRPGGKTSFSFGDLQALEGMSDDHVRAIERFQPYSNPGTPEARKLIRLGVLDNADKHRIDIPTFPTCIGPAEGEKVITSRPPQEGKGRTCRVRRQ